MGSPFSVSGGMVVESFEDQEKRWLALPMGEVLAWLAGQTEELWGRSVKDKAKGLRNLQSTEEYEKVESLHSSLARVVAWLASMQPPEAAHGAVAAVPEVVGVKQRPRGRVCAKCRRQIRRTSEMVTICPVQLPGLPFHDTCYRELEEEFGGKQ